MSKWGGGFLSAFFNDFVGGELDKKPGGFYWAGWADANPDVCCF